MGDLIYDGRDDDFEDFYEDDDPATNCNHCGGSGRCTFTGHEGVHQW